MTESTKDYLFRLWGTVAAFVFLGASGTLIYALWHGDLIISEGVMGQISTVFVGILVAMGQWVSYQLNKVQSNERESRIVEQVVRQIKLGYRNGDGQVIAQKVKEALQGVPGGERAYDPPPPVALRTDQPATSAASDEQVQP